MLRSLCKLRAPAVGNIIGQRFCASGPKKANFPLYELRYYAIKPEFYPAFLKLTSEKIHMRTEHSPLLGYWTSEFGALNEVVHLWGYESLIQRQRVRNGLVEDTKWNEEYMAKMRPMLASQENFLMLPNTDVIESFPRTDEVDLPAYELEVCIQTDEHAARGRAKFGGERIGEFKAVVGSLNAGNIQIWRYPSLEQFDGLVRSTVGTEQEYSNKFMLPTNFSPLY